MTPYETAYQAFHAEPTVLDWDRVVSDHVNGTHSYIVKTDSLFVLAREVCPDHVKTTMVDYTFHNEPSDHLHVTLVAGDLAELLAIIPGHIKTISFQKHGYGLHKLSVQRLRDRLRRNNPCIGPGGT